MKLARLADVAFWNRRARRSNRAVRRALAASRLSDAWSNTRQRTRIVGRLIRSSALVAMTGIALFVLLRILEIVFATSPRPALSFWGRGVTDEGYRDLLAAGLGAIATFLGLYYATVGVVASTVYQSVPSAVRSLFVEEPSGVVYMRGVVRAIILGIALLTMGSLGTSPAPLGLLVFAAYWALGVLRLMVLGSRIFNFFDPTSLGRTVANRFVRALARAGNPAVQNSAGAQLAAHSSASEALRTYRQLAVLLDARRSKDPAGASRLSAQLIQVAQRYAGVKTSIHVDSKWWALKPVHPNWMLLDHSRLEMALNTATGAPPRLEPNRMWVEEAVSETLTLTLKAEVAAASSSAVMGHAEQIARLTRFLAALFQVEEALRFEQPWRTALLDLVRDTGSDKSPAERLNRLAVAEQLSHPLIQLWLGHVDASEWIASQEFARELDRIVDIDHALAATRLPVRTVETAAKFRAQMAIERTAEGRRVTPAWWTRHYLARAVAEQHAANTASVRGAADPFIANTIELFIDQQDWECAAVVALGSLELFHKVIVHQPVLTRAVAQLQAMNNPSTENPTWATPVDTLVWAQAYQIKLLRYLATCLGHLPAGPHRDDYPDLRGQAFQVLADSTFDLLLADEPAAMELFAAVLVDADVMRGRAVEDLSGRAQSIVGKFAAEPWISMMELSGCALVMYRATGKGCWPQIEALWTKLVDSPHFGVDRLVSALVLSSDFTLGTAGAMRRMSRCRRLEGVLGDLGFKHWGYSSRSGDAGDDADPLVNAFAPGEFRVGEDLDDAFASVFLAPRLQDGQKLPRRTEQFIDSVARRTRSRGTSEGRRGRKSTDEKE